MCIVFLLLSTFFFSIEDGWLKNQFERKDFIPASA
jgi:hypothetical protein